MSKRTTVEPSDTQELEALDELMGILNTLDDGAQHRVIRYLAHRFDVII